MICLKESLDLPETPKQLVRTLALLRDRHAKAVGFAQSENRASGVGRRGKRNSFLPYGQSPVGGYLESLLSSNVRERQFMGVSCKSQVFDSRYGKRRRLKEKGKLPHLFPFPFSPFPFPLSPFPFP